VTGLFPEADDIWDALNTGTGKICRAGMLLEGPAMLPLGTHVASVVLPGGLTCRDSALEVASKVPSAGAAVIMGVCEVDCIGADSRRVGIAGDWACGTSERAGMSPEVGGENSNPDCGGEAAVNGAHVGEGNIAWRLCCGAKGASRGEPSCDDGIEPCCDAGCVAG